LLLGYTAAVRSGEKPANEELDLVFPPHRAVLFWGTFDLICQADGELKVDGKSQSWELFQPPLRVAHLGLEPGPHRLQIGPDRVDLFVSLGPDEHDWPSGWTTYRFHPEETGHDRCAHCHKTTKVGDKTAVGEWKEAEACVKCHRQRDLEKTHLRTLREMRECTSCHNLHASTRKALLHEGVKERL
jgi:hypothetical protein